MRPGICLYIHQAINPIVTLGTIQIKNPYNTLYCCANCNIIAGDLKLCIKENNPKKNPTIHPTLGPATIAPIIVGTCKIVALIVNKGINPYPDNPKKTVIPTKSPAITNCLASINLCGFKTTFFSIISSAPAPKRMQVET